ncbi:MAG TPA: lipase maturation factor family protein [Candidatus Limnocylindrales bacterium]|nr:lipase maturation factor family protein [Candidatus Limnocylindrales bacterium]
MPELTAPDYTIARFVIERGLALIYLVAFVVAARQFPALSGESGLQPAPRLLARVRPREAPSLFHWGYSDRRLRVVAWSGAVVAGLLVLGLPQLAPLPVTMLAWFTVWGLYQSVVNIGGTFYGFGWESLLLEAGFLAVFLGNAEIAPPWLVLLAFRWLAFRVEFGAGLIKLRGDRCWRDLTCMDFHHETQPMPNPLSWFFHHLPRPLHRVEVLGNFVAQLFLPWALFLPQPIASVAAALMIATQLYLVVSGNYAWLNWLTILAAVSGISDDAVRTVLPLVPAADGAGFAATPEWFTIAVLGLSILVLGLSWFPIRNMASPGQAMNASFNALHLVNTYGAFGTVGRERYELVIEGSTAERPAEPDWREYRFKGKPDDPRRLPPQVAPYHHRLDWMLWFIPLSPAYGGAWFMRFLALLLEADRPTLALLRGNPFPDGRPTWVRARFFHYRFSTWRELRASGAWWVRTPVEDYVPPVRLDDLVRVLER